MAQLSRELERAFITDPTHGVSPDSVCQDSVCLSDVLGLAGERVFGFLFVILALPSALPIPAPGYSIPFGVVLFVLAVQLIMGAKTPWLPQKFLKRPLALGTVQKITRAGLPWLRRIEGVSRPRLLPVCQSGLGRFIIGLAIALMAISMMIPIPGTNTLPAIGIFVTGFGLLDDDGVISLGGLMLCLCGLVLTSSILLGLALGGMSLIDWLQSLIHS
ncbi:exopolysaccharide biosynthesis protein [Candidatus Synechococcus calcipolaris G9]|uniref:Exopolysaccharide biosynthesis protein n=1 Tax=Candidatus Synechococcus calcipolaris G9 TaxID=1497997 RepID=A0ABT6EWB2_9SYNE|nr:exopolysaccharide biosynthesis protein [Candidatus Synechococcus calcipolaris]MDG2989541.1 exopolysaccharide biosynthesis protein [Candidatus Synechococcus calcipolaris G9]